MGYETYIFDCINCICVIIILFGDLVNKKHNKKYDKDKCSMFLPRLYEHKVHDQIQVNNNVLWDI